jgi:dienelactone hydrolase
MDDRVFHPYANAQHAFFNDNRPEVFELAAGDARAKTVAFFRGELRA